MASGADGLDDFILANIDDMDLRRVRTMTLRADAAGLDWGGHEIIEN